MTVHDSSVLVMANVAPSPAALAWIDERLAGRKVVALYLADDAETWPLPKNATRVTRGDVEDLERLRTEFLQFVDAWPRQTLGGVCGGKTFDEVFRRADGYSLWWTGPGIERHPDHGVFTQMREVWSFSAAMERWKCDAVAYLGNDATLATVIAGRCRELEVVFEVAPGSSRAAADTWGGRFAFAVESVANYLTSPWTAAIRALVCRWRVRRREDSAEDRRRPAVVMTSQFPREFRRFGDGAEVAFWSDVTAEFERSAPQVRLRHLVHTTGDKFNGLGPDRLHCHRAWPELNRLDGLVPLPEQTVGWWAWLCAAGPFLRTLLRYCRLERQADFRRSFRFAGCDVAALYVPALRKTIGRTHKWAMMVASLRQSLSAPGNVRAVLVYGEMYALGMPVIAAARSLGITTIGIQHGTIFPMHLIYTLPAGQTAGAPLPDMFAAYGDYAKEILADRGAFPGDRIVVTGGPRLDNLINSPADRDAARGRLQLPADKRIVLFATQIYPWFKTAAQALFEQLGARDDCVVCVKTHPLDKSMDAYRELAVGAKTENVVFFADRFDDLLAACDVLVSGSSTATLEAIMLGRRTICVNFSTEPDRYPYVGDGGALGGGDAEEFRCALNAALDDAGKTQDDERRRAFLARHVGPSADGRGAATFVAKVLELVDMNAPNRTAR
jgi:surface carbohydrate biosynthesis protein (TIGR04326 family)